MRQDDVGRRIGTSIVDDDDIPYDSIVALLPRKHIEHDIQASSSIIRANDDVDLDSLSDWRRVRNRHRKLPILLNRRMPQYLARDPNFSGIIGRQHALFLPMIETAFIENSGLPA